MDITVAQFRTMYPEFFGATDPQIAGWLTLAEILVNECAWGKAYQMGVLMFTAHNVALSMLNAAGAASGGVPGIARGVVSGESAGSLSVSYDTAASLIPGAGHWNLTYYGQQFAYYIRIFGAGGIQVGAGGAGGLFLPMVGFPFGPVGPGWGVPW